MKTLLCILFLALPAAAQPPVVAYVYHAHVVAIADGDTATANIELGFNTWTQKKLRLLNVYAAEKKQPNGPEHTAALVKLIPLGSPVIIRTAKDKTDKYGRVVAEVWRGKTNVNESMREVIGVPQGLGVPRIIPAPVPAPTPTAP